MQTRPLVTIVIPCYRQAHFLSEAVGSVLRQTLASWEIVIVDDGSPDDTAAVANQLITTNPAYTIRLLQQANAGLGHARNAGMRIGSAPYILPLDADDTIAPDLLARAVPVLETQPAVGFVYSDVVWFGAEQRINRPGPFDSTRLALDNYITAHSLLRRSAWEAARGYCGREVLDGFEDWDLWLSIVELGWQGAYIPEPLLGYRRHASSMLIGARRNDLQLRAKLILRHQRLYARPFVTWAAGYLSAAHSGRAWPRFFLAYALLIAHHHPQALPKTLARPLFARLSARQQGLLRRVAQYVQISGQK